MQRARRALVTAPLGLARYGRGVRRWTLRSLLLLALLGASGCRLDATVLIDVAEDGSGEVVVAMAFDEVGATAIGGVGDDAFESVFTADLIEAGWEVSGPVETSDGGLTVAALREFGTGDELAQLLAGLLGDDSLLDLELHRRAGFARTEYRIGGLVDLSDGPGVLSDAEMDARLGGTPLEIWQRGRPPGADDPPPEATLELVARLPGPSGSNATHPTPVDEARWAFDLMSPPSGPIEIEAFGEVTHASRLAGAAVAGIAAVSMVALGAGVAWARRRPKTGT